MDAALVVIVMAVGVGVLGYIYATGRQRSARWRDRMIAKHGHAGYVRRRRGWRIGTWGLVIAALCAALVPLFLHR